MVKPTQKPPVVHSRGPDPIDVEVGINLRRARRDRGLSQAEVGDALGITFQQVQKYERGANRVSASMLVKAARFLGIRPADLLPPDDGARPAESLLRRVADSPAAAKAVEAYCAIPSPALRRTILQLMRALTAEAGPVNDD
jgi:transcriptional regulator with XRE-family HTH domain